MTNDRVALGNKEIKKSVDILGPGSLPSLTESQSDKR